MHAGPSLSEKRQFGRRSSSIGCSAVFPGHVLVPCTIINLSDGGALLSFDGDAKPPPTLRLTIDDTSFNLLCEVRHQSGSKVGVRFARLAEGIALNRHFQRIPTEPADIEARLEPPCRPARAAAIGNRELRRIMLGILLALAHARLQQELLDKEQERSSNDRPALFAGAFAVVAALTWQRRHFASLR